jgi:hypothetical protein
VFPGLVDQIKVVFNHAKFNTDLFEQEATWNFLRRILELGVRLIRPDVGKYMTHCNGKAVAGVLAKYEDMLQSLRVSDPESGRRLKCTFSRSQSFVPSFMEVWVFYKLRVVEIEHEVVPAVEPKVEPEVESEVEPEVEPEAEPEV